MIYKLNCNLNDNDYYEFNKFHINDSPDSKKLTLILKLCLPITIFLSFIFETLPEGDIYFSIFIFIFGGIVSLLWFLFIGKISLIFLKLYLTLMKKHGKLPYSDATTMEFYEDYFIEKTENTKTEVQYNAIYKVRIHNKKAIYIYTNSAMAHIVPFNAFTSDDERTQFINFITEKNK